ncbi:hypothetical protein C5F59_014950 [Streptomyces sp. QL37]|uniref:hypothetical protein n=1 Tax=Streptomyces sp. QL37 TaxID=2093747 RepID=UPI0021CB5E8A|nr:hypothetical protein [Streptomyces sp. QL37]
MRVTRPVVIGWVLLVAGGWAATLWLGEPSATAGPGPTPTAGVTGGNPEPGPQPEGSCPTPSPTESSDPLSTAKVPDAIRDGRAVQVDCATLVIRDRATAR